MKDQYQILNEKNAQAESGGGAKNIQRQHDTGKMTARERLALLFDADSFSEIGKFVQHRCTDFGMENKKFLGDGVIVGYGQILGRQVFAYAQDSTVLGGALGEAGANKIKRIIAMACRTLAPVIGLNDSGGARVQEGVDGMAGLAELAMQGLSASGVIPQISVIMGSTAGGPAYYAGGTDFVIMVAGTAHMFVTSPEVIRTVTQEDVTREQLGGAEVHTRQSGVAHFSVPDETAAILLVRRLLSFFPSNNLERPPGETSTDPWDREIADLDTLIPESEKTPYDMQAIIDAVVDDHDFLAVHERFAANIIVGFARMGGYSVGIIANQPTHLSGCLDIAATLKASRFIRFCDAFNIPLVVFVDVPGFLPGVAQEQDGIINHGTKLFFAYGEATVPKITIVTRKAYGGGYALMGSKHFGADVNFAFPSAEIAVMGPEGAVAIMFRKEIAAAADPRQHYEDLVQEHGSMYKGLFANPYAAAERGYVDDIIFPRETRKKIIQSLRMLRTKVDDSRSARKHNTMPL